MINETSNISDKTLAEKTGKNWVQWIITLDQIGAGEMSHTAIAKFLKDKYHVDAWHAQMITTTYENERGRRQKHQKADGFEISVSKTFNLALDTLYQFWLSDKNLEEWLGEVPSKRRKANENKSLRFLWSDKKTGLEVRFHGKGNHKTQMVVQQSKISSKESAEKRKDFWREKMKSLEGIPQFSNS